MRKIEREMIAAIKAGKEWKKANIRVHPIIGGMEVQLHGNTLGVYGDVGGGRYEFIVNRETFKRYPTATTRSRLCALGIDASVKNFKACIDGVEL